MGDPRPQPPDPRARRVAVLLPSLAGGGAERSMARLASGLAARGVAVSLWLGRASGPYLAELDPRVTIVDLGADSMLAAVPAIVRRLRAERPAALLAAMSHVNVAAVLAHRIARSAARLVLSERIHVSALLGGGGWRLAATGVLMRATYRRADAVVAVSRGVADDLQRRLRLDPTRVSVLPNPIVDAALEAQASHRPAHRWLDAPRDAPVILAAGRLNAQKDFATLVTAFARLRAGRPARLLILGEGELRSALEAQARALGVAADVALPGFDAAPFAAMRAADLFVLSSRYEGLPGVLIQAMACGTRVVATDCPSGPREVLEDGRWGRLVPVGDAAALADAMAAALDDEAPPDVRRRAADFDAERAVERYADVLGVALAPRPAGLSRQASNISTGHSR